MDEQVDFQMPEDVVEQLVEHAKLDSYLLGVVFGAGLGGAVVAHLLIRWFGWVKGLAAFAAIYGTGASSIGPWLLKKILKVDSIDGLPVWELPAGQVEELQELVGSSV